MSMSYLAAALGLRRRVARRIYRDFASLDDRTLVDIGLVRAELRLPGRERRLGPIISLETQDSTAM